MTYHLKQSEYIEKPELAIIHNRRAVKRLKIQQAFASQIFKTIAVSSILSSSFFGINALVCWKLEMNTSAIPTINSRQEWQTRKHISLGWMLITFSSFLSSACVANMGDSRSSADIYK